MDWSNSERGIEPGGRAELNLVGSLAGHHVHARRTLHSIVQPNLCRPRAEASVPKGQPGECRCICLGHTWWECERAQSVGIPHHLLPNDGQRGQHR
jgi:hypothetical protein